MRHTLCFLILIVIIFLSCNNPLEDNSPPDVAIDFTPGVGVVYDTLDIECTAVDDDGVENVELYVDNIGTGIIDNSEPYLLRWDTTPYPNGLYSLTVRAVDENQNVSISDSIVVDVDNTKILWSDLNYIWTMNIDGNNSRVIAQGGAHALSPSGVDIVFDRVNFESGTADNDIFIMGREGKDVRNLTNSSVFQYWPIFSPNGQQILFRAYNPGGLWLMGIDGSNQTNIFSEFEVDWIEGFPRFSSDGSKIVFSMGLIDNTKQIFTMNIDGSNLTQVTTAQTSKFTPGFSPDDSKILYISSWDLFSVDTDGDNVTQLTFSGQTRFAGFHPNGDRIIYSEAGILKTMRLDGSDSVALTSSLFSKWPSYSSDNSKIVFVGGEKEGGVGGYHDEIYLMNEDGSNRVRLTNSDGQDKYLPSFLLPIHGLD